MRWYAPCSIFLQLQEAFGSWDVGLESISLNLHSVRAISCKRLCKLLSMDKRGILQEATMAVR